VLLVGGMAETGSEAGCMPLLLLLVLQPLILMMVPVVPPLLMLLLLLMLPGLVLPVRVLPGLLWMLLMLLILLMLPGLLLCRALTLQSSNLKDMMLPGQKLHGSSILAGLPVLIVSTSQCIPVSPGACAPGVPWPGIVRMCRLHGVQGTVTNKQNTNRIIVGCSLDFHKVGPTY